MFKVKKYSKRWYKSFWKKVTTKYNDLGLYRVVKNRSTFNDDSTSYIFVVEKYYNTLSWCELRYNNESIQEAIDRIYRIRYEKVVSIRDRLSKTIVAEIPPRSK